MELSFLLLTAIQYSLPSSQLKEWSFCGYCRHFLYVFLKRKKKDRTKLRIFCSFFLNKSFLCWNLHPENVLIFQNAKTKELANFEGIGLSALEEQQEKTKDRRTHVDMVRK